MCQRYVLKLKVRQLHTNVISVINPSKQRGISNNISRFMLKGHLYALVVVNVSDGAQAIKNIKGVVNELQ
jgi:hypothetical protein